MSGRSDEDPAGWWSRTARLTGLAPPETWISPKIEVRVSPVHGKGTFAIAAIAAGEAVQVWGQRWQGSLTAEYTADAGRAALAARRGLVVMQWDEELYSIERGGRRPGLLHQPRVRSDALVRRRVHIAGPAADPAR